jgi:hypothetical protein
MGKKLLLAAVITFLSMAVCAAFDFDGSLAGARPHYLGDVVIYSICAYPLSVAIVFWEHRSSKALKYCSAGAGLMITLILIWNLGPVAAMSSDFKTSVAVVNRLILIFSCFIFSSTLLSIVGRLSIRLWRLLRYLALKLKNLGRALPNEGRYV